MALIRSSSADKNIVDRRRPHRNSDVARAVRKTRDRLSQQVGNPVFDRELLKLHAARHDQQRDGNPAAGAVDRRGRPVRRHGHRHTDLGADHRHLLCRPRHRRAARRAHRRRRHRRCRHAPQLPARAFRQRARLDLFRIPGLRRLPGRPVHRHQGRRDTAGHRGDRADRLVAARRADRHLRAAGRRLCLYRHQAVGDRRGDHGRPC